MKRNLGYPQYEQRFQPDAPGWCRRRTPREGASDGGAKRGIVPRRGRKEARFPNIGPIVWRIFLLTAN